MPRINRLLPILLVIALLAGCLPNAPASPASKKSFQSNQPRVTAPQVESADKDALAKGNAAFALDLYRALNKADQNAFLSPYSISLALAMTYGGAKGATASQMADVLHFDLPQERLHPAFNALDQQLAARKDTPGQGADGKGFRFNVVNDIWGQQDYTFLPAYLDMLASNYGAGLRPMDFKANPEQARKQINDYIAQKTEQRIKDLIPAGQIDALTRLVLTNAIYFNAAWLFPFEKDLTVDKPFTLPDGSQVTVPMMKRPAHGSLAYAAGDGYQLVALPYENSDLRMLLLVPDQGKLGAFEAGLDAAKLETMLNSMEYKQVIVSMPRFKIETEYGLGQTLQAMGMKDAFDPDVADFSGMDGDRALYISAVIHKAFVSVDEAGTEAAAATAVIMETTSAQIDQPIELTIDRPFLFMIRDEPTNTILFMGKVTNPTK